MNKQVFQDCSGMGVYDAVFSETYHALNEDYHRAVSMSVARNLCKEWRLPGFWRVKQVAK